MFPDAPLGSDLAIPGPAVIPATSICHAVGWGTAKGFVGAHGKCSSV